MEQVEEWGSVQRHADLRRLLVETIFAVCWNKLSHLTMLSPDGHLSLLLEEDPAVKRSSRVGRGMEGAGGTTEGVEGLLDLAIIFSG